ATAMVGKRDFSRGHRELWQCDKIQRRQRYEGREQLEPNDRQDRRWGGRPAKSSPGVRYFFTGSEPRFGWKSVCAPTQFGNVQQRSETFGCGLYEREAECRATFPQG